MRTQGAGGHKPLTDGRIDVIQEIVRRMRRIEVGGLAGIHNRSAADADEPVEITILGESDGRLER